MVKNIFSCSWVDSIKRLPNGKVEQYKSRLVANINKINNSQISIHSSLSLPLVSEPICNVKVDLDVQLRLQGLLLMPKGQTGIGACIPG